MKKISLFIGLFSLLVIKVDQVHAASFFQDGFYEAGGTNVNLENHTATDIASNASNGGTWTPIDSTNRGVVIHSGAKAVRPINALGRFLNSGSPPTADYYIDDVLLLNDFNHGYSLPGLRVSGNSSSTLTGYFPEMSTGATFELFRIVGGTSTGLATWTPSPALSTGTTLPIRFQVVGSTLTLYANTGSGLVSVLTYIDSAPIVAAGNPGLYNTGNGAPGDTDTVQTSQYQATAFVTTTLAANPMGWLASASSGTLSFTGGSTAWLSAPPSFGISGGTGASISSITVLTNTTCTANFTPGTSTGTITITDSTDNSSVLIQVVSVLPTDSNIVWSPWSWGNDGAQDATNLGAYARVPFAGTSIKVVVDVSNYVSNGAASSNYPLFTYNINGGEWVQRLLTSADTVVVLTPTVSTGTNVLSFYLQGATTIAPPLETLRIVGFDLDSGDATYPISQQPKKAIMFGDSITAGYHLPFPANYAGSDPLSTWVPLTAAARTAEYGQIGFTGQSWQVPAGVIFWVPGNPIANQPPFRYWNGSTRLSGGKLSPMPDYVFVNEGTNDGVSTPGNTTQVQATVADFLPNMRSVVNSNTWIFIAIPYGGYFRTQINAAFNAYQASTPDPFMKIIDAGVAFDAGLTGTPSFNSHDGTHLNTTAQAQYAILTEDQISQDINGSGGMCGSVSITPGSGQIIFH